MSLKNRNNNRKIRDIVIWVREIWYGYGLQISGRTLVTDKKAIFFHQK